MYQFSHDEVQLQREERDTYPSDSPLKYVLPECCTHVSVYLVELGRDVVHPAGIVPRHLSSSGISSSNSHEYKLYLAVEAHRDTGTPRSSR